MADEDEVHAQPAEQDDAAEAGEEVCGGVGGFVFFVDPEGVEEGGDDAEGEEEVGEVGLFELGGEEEEEHGRG